MVTLPHPTERWDAEANRWEPAVTRGVSIVVLAFNEAANLTGAVREIREAAMVSLDDYEVIVVNDGSTDGTGEIADWLALHWGDVRVVHHPENRGLRAGYETGLSTATLPYAVWLPADREMAPESIAAILRAIGTADLVIPYHGNPSARGWFRRLLTWGSTTQLNGLLGYPLHYWQGTVVYPTELARRLPRTEAGFFFCAEMLAHALDAGLSYVEIPLAHTDRQHGRSKAVGLRQIWRAQTLIVRLWWRLRVRTAAEALGFALEHR